MKFLSFKHKDYFYSAIIKRKVNHTITYAILLYVLDSEGTTVLIDRISNIDLHNEKKELYVFCHYCLSEKVSEKKVKHKIVDLVNDLLKESK